MTKAESCRLTSFKIMPQTNELESKVCFFCFRLDAAPLIDMYRKVLICKILELQRILTFLIIVCTLHCTGP